MIANPSFCIYSGFFFQSKAKLYLNHQLRFVVCTLQTNVESIDNDPIIELEAKLFLNQLSAVSAVC